MASKVVIENARVIFRNFSGKEGMYNREGDRNFCVLLDPQFAQDMANDGWNIKTLKAREEADGDEDQPYVQVSVNYKGRPPRIFMISSRGRNQLGEEEIELLDWADFANVDLILNPYEWLVNGKTGVKAYLETMYVTIQEDELSIKYADVPDANQRVSRVVVE